MKKIVLYGRLAQQFGAEHHLSVTSAAEAVSALEANNPGQFMAALREGRYRVATSAAHAGLEEEELRMQLGSDEIHLEPIIEGSKSQRGKGIVTAVLGIALIAAAVVFAPAAAPGAANLFGASMGATAFTVLGSTVTFGNIAMLGLALTLSGVSTLMAPSLQASGPRERPEEMPSFMFDGAVNMVEQGGPVPVLYGRMLVGSVVISGGLSAEKLDTT